MLNRSSFARLSASAPSVRTSTVPSSSSSQTGRVGFRFVARDEFGQRVPHAIRAVAQEFVGLERIVGEQFAGRVKRAQFFGFELCDFIPPCDSRLRSLIFQNAVEIRRERGTTGEGADDGGERPRIEEDVGGGENLWLRSESIAAFCRGNAADGIGIGAAAEALKQGERFLPTLLALALVVELRRMHDIDLGVLARAETVHAPEALRHAVEGREIAHEMVGADIDADFARARADEIDGAFRRSASVDESSSGGRKRRNAGLLTSSSRSFPRIVPVRRSTFPFVSFPSSFSSANAICSTSFTPFAKTSTARPLSLCRRASSMIRA